MKTPKIIAKRASYILVEISSKEKVTCLLKLKVIQSQNQVLNPLSPCLKQITL